MNDYLIFLISTLATYRLSLMFSKELGPCRMFERFRGLFTPGGCWHKGVSCILCESVWWSGLITLWLLAAGFVAWQLCAIYWLGVSGLSVLANQVGPKIE